MTARSPYYIYTAFLLGALLLTGCGTGDKQVLPNEKAVIEEDLGAKAALQGIWIDEETETVAFLVKGDTIFYPDTAIVPVHFSVRADTLFLAGGSNTRAYPIDKIGEDFFRIHSATGEAVRLVRSNDLNDSVYFLHKQAATLTYNEVVKKDTVVFQGGERYHCYVYVNPSQLKVYKTSYTDEGIAVENVYYDNVIHICVYKGKVCLFSRDYTKKDFEGMVPEGFLNQAILANMVFSKTNSKGFHFNATVCIPDEASCYMINICVDLDGKPTLELIEY